MRLDKYLKVSRLIKRRTVAKAVADAGKISLNGRPAKAASDVKVGDRLCLGFGSHQLEVEVLQVADSVAAKDAKELYRVISDTLNEDRLD